MEFKTISDVISTYSNTCMTPVGHTGDAGPQNLLRFPLKSGGIQGFPYFGSAYMLYSYQIILIIKQYLQLSQVSFSLTTTVTRT